MATTINGTALSNELVLDYSDYTGETARVTIPLDGATSDANIISIVDDIIALSNGLIVPTIRRTFSFAGYASAGRPLSESQNLLAAIVALDFPKVSPINAAKTVEKQVPILAYIDAIRNDDIKPHVPVTDNATLNALVALLEDKLDFLAADGTRYPGGWTYNPASKFGTKLSVTDGL